MDLMTIGFIAAAAVAVVEAIMLLKRPAADPAPAAPAVPAAPAADTGKPSQELVAAVSAALAEELGTDITRIRIKSITKL